MGDMILYRSGGGGTASIYGYPPNPVTNFVAKGKNKSVSLTWNDPDDLVMADGTVVSWAYTRIVRKTGSYPKDENDGTTVVQSSTKNQYAENGYLDTNLTNLTTYYYCAFTCSDDGIFNTERVGVTVQPTPYKIMTMKINEADSNPSTCCTYADDAIGMPSGVSENAVSQWQSFFKYKPCIVKNGVVSGYLNPNDWTKFDTGSASNIATIDNDPNSDVMIEFPRMGLDISKAGNIITIRITDDPDASGFVYDSFRWDGKLYDHLYIGAFPLELVSNTGVSHPTVGFDTGAEKYCAQYFGTRTEWLEYINSDKKKTDRWFYIHYANRMLIMAMTLMQFKTLQFNSIYRFGNLPHNIRTTGSAAVKQLYSFGMVTAYQYYSNEASVRLFGIDSMIHWGVSSYNQAYSEYYDGAFFYKRTLYYLDDMKPNPQSFDTDKTTRYKKYSMDDYGVPVKLSGLGTVNWFITKTAGNPYFGFIPTEASGGSTTTYYCEVAEFDIASNNSNGNGSHWDVWRNFDYASTSSNDTCGFFSQQTTPLNASYEALGDYGNEEGLLRLCYLN